MSLIWTKVLHRWVGKIDIAATKVALSLFVVEQSDSGEHVVDQPRDIRHKKASLLRSGEGHGKSTRVIPTLLSTCQL